MQILHQIIVKQCMSEKDFIYLYLIYLTQISIV